MVTSRSRDGHVASHWVVRAAAISWLLCGHSGCKPPPAAAPAPNHGNAVGGLQPQTGAQPPTGSSAASGAAPNRVYTPSEVLPDDPRELSRLSNEVHREKIRLIESVHDLETAKAVAGRFPAVNERHRLIEEKLGNGLYSEDMKQQLERDFQAERDQLRAEYARHYVRVAFIPGAWEHMHPELAPLADMTVIPQDSQGLERAAVRMLTESLAILRQVTDANKAQELSPRYRVATCRIGAVLGRLSAALGGTGAQEQQTPQVRELRRQFDEEQRRLRGIQGAYAALQIGQQHVAAAAAPANAGSSAAETDRIVAQLRSQDQRQIINALNPLQETTPSAANEVIGAEVIRLLDFEPVAGSAAEAIKRGWFSPSQIPQLQAVIPKLKPNNLHYILYEGISRVPNLERVQIEFLAALFDENPGKAVTVLRNVGPAAQPSIFPFADSSRVEVRQCVCEVLRDIGTDDSQPVLQKLSQDSDRGVASKAQEALREIGRPARERPHLRNRQ